MFTFKISEALARTEWKREIRVSGHLLETATSEVCWLGCMEDIWSSLNATDGFLACLLAEPQQCLKPVQSHIPEIPWNPHQQGTWVNDFWKAWFVANARPASKRDTRFSYQLPPYLEDTDGLVSKAGFYQSSVKRLRHLLAPELTKWPRGNSFSLKKSQETVRN